MNSQKSTKNFKFTKLIIKDISLLDNESFNKLFNDSDEFMKIPIILLNAFDFMKVNSFIFEGNMDEDFMNLFIQRAFRFFYFS